MADTQSTFVWYELMTTDLDAAGVFYADVVGWTAQDSGMPGMRYTLLNAGPKQVAGAMTLPQEVCDAGGRPGWIGYVGVADADAAVAKLTEAGGQVRRPPADIPGIGRFAMVADPHGAAFALFQPQGGSPEPAQPMAPGHVGWHELYAGDGPEAFAFYSGQFGWSKGEALDMGPMGIYQLFDTGGMATGGIMTKPPEIPHPYWGFYFTVPEINAAVERVKAGGGQILNGPRQVPGGTWIIQGLDPQGAAFALVAPPQ
jgi:predicted enzyme related to lactoylglutathione lyase